MLKLTPAAEARIGGLLIAAPKLTVLATLDNLESAVNSTSVTFPFTVRVVYSGTKQDQRQPVRITLDATDFVTL